MKYIPEQERLIDKKTLEASPSVMAYIDMIKRYRYYLPNLSMVSIIKESHRNQYEALTIQGSYESNQLKDTEENRSFKEMYEAGEPHYLALEVIPDYQKYLSEEKNWFKPFPSFLREVEAGNTKKMPQLNIAQKEILINYHLQQFNIVAIKALNDKYKKFFEANEKKYIHYLFFSERVDLINELKENGVFKEKSIDEYIEFISQTIYMPEVEGIMAGWEKLKLQSIVENVENRKILKL